MFYANVTHWKTTPPHFGRVETKELAKFSQPPKKKNQLRCLFILVTFLTVANITKNNEKKQGEHTAHRSFQLLGQRVSPVTGLPESNDLRFFPHLH